MRRTLLLAPLLLAACALDPVGERDADLTGATGPGTGTGSTGVGSSGAGSGPSAGGGSPTSGQGGDGGSHQGGSSQGGGGQGGGEQGGGEQGGGEQGGGEQGGASQGGGGHGGAGQGGAGGAGGDGGDGQASTGQGGQGGVGQGGQGGDTGMGGAGGSDPCGNGTIEPPEECDGPELECDQDTCTFRGACGIDQEVAFAPGGVSIPGDTSDDATITSFGTCADTLQAGTHVYTYTTGPTAAFVQAVVEHATTGLFDPVLSMHASCYDDAITTCFTGDATPPCCSNALPFQDEGLLTNLLAPGTTITVAVSGYLGNEGTYDVVFRDLRYLFLELFEPAPGQFSSSPAWVAYAGQGCAGGSRCMRYSDVGDNTVGDAMTSASFAAPGIGDAILTWHQRIDENVVSLEDEYLVQVSTDGGANWDEVYRYAGIVLEEEAPQVDIGFVAGQDDVRVRFVARADSGNTGAWYVDNVQVIGW